MEGATYEVYQGPGGAFSHTGLNRHAWDFGLPEGTSVCAVAEGRVVRVKQDSTVGGTEPQHYSTGNTIVLDHGDGVFSQYLHLRTGSARVAEGDIVRGGQVVALSGSTGYSSVPHLHFQVQDATGQSMPCAFLDVPGDGVPQQGKRYTSGNDGLGVSRYAGESALPLETFQSNGVRLDSSNLPAHLLRTDRTYRMTGAVRRGVGRVALFLMNPEGGKPLLTVYAPVNNDGNFSCEFTLGLVRRSAEGWSEFRTQSNLFSLAIVPVRGDGTFWSSFSVPVSVR
jgi:murein DD-endopeptidase MepM/ murein hydrolase activator NlpD